MAGNKRKNSKTKHKKTAIVIIKVIIMLLLIVAATYGIKTFVDVSIMPRLQLERLEKAKLPDWIDVQLLGYESNSRSGERLENYKNIVIHYVANPGSTAQGNHDYFANPSSNVSSHFIVGLNGEIIQCLPIWEQSAASNWRNNDTISIEVCHEDESGYFSDVTYNALVKLTVWLADIGHLDEEDVIRHYDITGKLCPKYFVEHEDAWEEFKGFVRERLK